MIVTFLIYSAFVIKPYSSEPIYFPQPTTTKPLHQERIIWPKRPAKLETGTSLYSNYDNPQLLGTSGTTQSEWLSPERKQSTWNGFSCPPGATGAFPYIPDCRRFLNCWKGRGFLTLCAPGSLFNPETLECDFPSKVRCISNHQVLKERSDSFDVTGAESQVRINYDYHNFRHQGSELSHQHSTPGVTEGELRRKKSCKKKQVEIIYPQKAAEVRKSTLQQGYGSQRPQGFQDHHNHPPRHHHHQHHHHHGNHPHNYQHHNHRNYHHHPGQKLPEPYSVKEDEDDCEEESVDQTFRGVPSYSPGDRRQQGLGHTQSRPEGPRTSSHAGVQPPLPKPPVPDFGYPSMFESSARPVDNFGKPSQVFNTRDQPTFNEQSGSQSTNYNYFIPVTNRGGYNPEGNPIRFPQSNFNIPGHTLGMPDPEPHASSPQGVATSPPEAPYYQTQTAEGSAFSNSKINYDGVRTYPDYESDKFIPNFPEPKCPQGFSGLAPHPDCTKFLSCSNGRTFVMNCTSNTRFNPRLLICDHPEKVNCDGGENFRDTEPGASSGVAWVVAPPQTEPDQDIDMRINLNNRESKTANPTYSKDLVSSPKIRTTPKPRLDASSSLHAPHPEYPHMKGFFITPQNTRSSKVEQVDSNQESGFSRMPTSDELSEVTDSRKLQNSHRTQQTVSPRMYEESSLDDKTSIVLPKSQTPKKNSSDSGSHIFKPNEPNSKVNVEVKYKGKKLMDRQVLRLRGGPTRHEGFVEIQLSQGTWGVICDQPNQWSVEEADIVCKDLGFNRGAELSWQGKPADGKAVTSRIISTDSIRCVGHEESILDCSISNGQFCDIERQAVWVRCYSNGLSQCKPGETSFDNKCYSIVVPKEDSTSDLAGFSQGEALAHCRSTNGHLVDITSQMENDFISEWLIREQQIESIMTSGVGVSVMGSSIWIWEGNEDPFAYHNWWPGWHGGKSVPPKTHSGRALCIVARRFFPCPDATNSSETQLCDSQYYFWDVEDCGSMSNKHPYVCEREADDIGCLLGNGANYEGKANVTAKGHACLSWDSNSVLPALRYRVSDAILRNKLKGHNFCRNIDGIETEPWCFIETAQGPQRESCDIPQCMKGIEKSAQYAEYTCDKNQFSCQFNGECVPSVWVCDGRNDCSNGRDEADCSSYVAKFSSFSNSRLIGHDTEKWVTTPAHSCAQRCLEARNFECRSFSHSNITQECYLSESNVGLSGSLAQNETNWTYYEMKSKTLRCEQMFVCANGKCINSSEECNGRNNCGDGSDEKNCSWLDLGVQLRLAGGNTPNEGIVEIKVLEEWGVICDDQFDLRDAAVVCRHLGFSLGAAEINKHFSTNNKQANGTKYFLDDLQCRGNETNISDCEHNGWGVHDCGPDEAAGVVCKVAEEDCGFNYWQCRNTAECIPLNFLCDNVPDCSDKSDEDASQCKSPIEVRLVGPSRGGKPTEGRLEIRRFGVWGTVCDDDFGPKEASVVCNSLGYNGQSQAFKEAAFGAGSGVIWLDQVHCTGNETNVAQCLHDSWGQTNCRHNEDVSVVCSPQTHKNVAPKASKPTPGKGKDFKKISWEEILPKKCGVIQSGIAHPPSHFKPKVVSGFETPKGSYPWQASVRVKSVSGKSSHWCGAVLLSNLHVLTAGHCLRDYIKSSYFVRAGDHDNEVDEETEQDVEIEDIWIHSDLDKGARLNNDIALIKLKAPGFEFTKWVLPACLPPSSAEYSPGRNCTISGWGSNGSPGSGFARTLHATWITMLPVEECKAKYVYGSEAISEGMFCAGSLTGGPDSCQGDSGGPFLCPHNGHFTLFGITSWGHGCGRVNSPGVYTKITYYMDWIRDKIIKSVENQYK